MMQPDDLFDLRGLLPPDKEKKGNGAHTYLPQLVTRKDFDEIHKPRLKQNLAPDVFEYIVRKVSLTFELRNKLKELRPQIERIVGEGNFSSLWLDREAFSTDSMEHRALVTEAVVHVYSATALQKLVRLLYRNGVPMIPYGEGGGYNMGVTPMAPAVTVSLRGIDHISAIRPSRFSPDRFEISVGAGVPFKDLQAYVSRRGYVLRCDPNTPRAATGGIAGTGSNAGRKAWEVIVHGRAVFADGLAACFAPDEQEQKDIVNEPFLMARKFYSVRDPEALKILIAQIAEKDFEAQICPSPENLHVPLRGLKASANMAAQKALFAGDLVDQMSEAPSLPLSCFVGAEGCTGFIYEVTFELEKPKHFLQASRWHFSSTEAAMAATKAIKALPREEQPVFFEIITGQSIQKFLIKDFPAVFSAEDAAVLFVAGEGNTPAEAEKLVGSYLTLARSALASGEAQGSRLHSHLTKVESTKVLNTQTESEIFEHFKKPREELPKRLRTKCKTDMEIRTEYLPEVIQIVEAARPRQWADRKVDVLFGHLTPAHTAIMHWNIGGFDLYDEEQADVAWEYLEGVISKAQSLAPADDVSGSARFTGEHGVAGKAPFLWLNYIPPQDFERMCRVKDLLDPKDLYNPETLFLRTSISRSLRARLIAFGDKALKETARSSAENYIIEESLRCTRCNSCKICPVIDAEHELEKESGRNSKSSVLPSKRNILMFLEKMVVSDGVARSVSKEVPPGTANGSLVALQAATQKMFAESAELLKKCFYCRKCDKACPVNIDIHPLVRAYHAVGKLKTPGSRLWGFLYERLMGEDFFKAWTYRMVALGTLLGGPVFRILLQIPFLPRWIKTYFSPPTLVLSHYEPLKEGYKLRSNDNFVLIENKAQSSKQEVQGVQGVHVKLANGEKNTTKVDVFAGKNETQGLVPQHTSFVSPLGEVYIRYRGCMDTFGNPQATTSVDSYFKDVLGVALVDLEKKLCCGFPFEAEGLHERAQKSQMISLVEIAKCIGALKSDPNSANSKMIVFSNCPTCCEAIKEMAALLKEPDRLAWVLSKAGLPANTSANYLAFSVQDTAEIAVRLLERQAERDPLTEVTKKPMTVGLKVPCHNTPAATQTQLKLLGLYYVGVQSYDRCCGLSGTGRLKHPKIGTKISEKLFEQILEDPPQVVVSGCPSCRDGVKIQRNILIGESDPAANFEISGIFEQITKDFSTKSARS